jgi:Zn-dependent M16 (insulinase) family peptidase
MLAKPIHFNTIGQQYGDFEVTHIVDIPELQSCLIELVHRPSHAQVMHIANEDSENLFCLSFQTFPEKSDGVAHILEHTVLCGSKKFPVKDPFFSMTRRSLNTFMNALTGSDFTCYPAATQVKKDFYNLLDVYMDAVFFPNLSRLSFLQEGHRIEFADPQDPTSLLEYKGVVLNEMKGVMSSPSARLSEAIHEALYPHLTYGVNFGGNPTIIPQLTYEELIAFHKKFYHPSHCLFFFYGNFPLQGHLDFIAEHALKDVIPAPPIPPLLFQKKNQEPKYLTMYYPIAHDEEDQSKSYVSFGWLTCPIIDQEQVLALSILEIILLDTDASLLKMAWLKSGLCKLVNSHMDTDVHEGSWIITLRGCDPNMADECEHLLNKTLEDIVAQGIPLNLVENAIHQLEIYRSEIGGDHAPFGLSLFMRSALLKQHHVLPEEGLKIHTLFDVIHKKALNDPNYFSAIIKKVLLDNKHRVRVVMKPDKNLTSTEHSEERRLLEEIRGKLSDKDIKNLLTQSQKLAKFQQKQQEENIDVLPKLDLEDIPKASRHFELTRETIGRLHVFHHGCFTNKILYTDLVFQLPYIPIEDLSFVRLFCILMTQMGCGARNYAENLEFIQANTGGIAASLTFNLQAQNHCEFHPSIHLRSKALYRKTPKLFSLLADLTAAVDFTDLHRLKEVMLKHYTGLESSLAQNAMRYAINLSASQLDVASSIANSWYGLDYYWKIKEIATDLNHHLVPLSRKMQELQHKLLGLDNSDFVITCDKEFYNELKDHGFYGLTQIPTKPFESWKGDYPLKKIPSQGRIIASPIAFIGKVFKTVSYVDPDSPALALAASLLDNLTLHPLIREQGGAYGSGAVSNAISGNFYFYSHRDPNISRTLEAFEIAIAHISEGKFDEADLEEAKFDIIQGLDEPVPPGHRGEHAYGWYCEGKTQPIRQAFRDRLLSLTSQQIIEAVDKHIIPQFKHGITAVFAGSELLEKENEILQAKGYTPLVIEKI